MTLSVFAAAADAPDTPAVIAEGRAVTYAQLARQTREGIRWLRARGLDEAPLVALVPTNDLASLEMVHALISLRVPMLMIHPRLTTAERDDLLALHHPAAVIDARWRDTGRAPSGMPGPDPDPDYDYQYDHEDREHPLAILSTSGTTGRPRGVVLSRRAFVASAAASAANLGWQEGDRWLLRLPVAHVGGLSVATRCLLGRRTVVLSDARETRELAATIQRERITILSLVPTLLTRLLDLEPAWDPPPHLRAILLGGAAASPALLGRAADRGWPILTTYGLTEACSQVTTQPYGTVNRGELGSGRPLPGTEVRIGADDEIQVRGPTLLSGYVPSDGLPDPAALSPHAPEDSFLADPFLDDGWFPTGDRGRLDADGNLHVFGRRADRIVTGGENVDPVEVEQVLERLAGVRQACVFGLADEEWGAVVCAAVVAGPGFDRAAATRALRKELAPFKRPRRLALMDTLATNRNGKVDRSATAELASDRLEPL